VAQPEVLEQEAIAPEPVPDSPLDEVVEPDTSDDVQPVVTEEPKPKSIDDLSDDELLEHPRFKTQLERKSQSERDQAVAKANRENRQKAAEFIQRGGVTQTLSQAVQRAIETGESPDPRVIQSVGDALFNHLATENYNQFSAVVQEAIPSDAKLSKDIVDGLTKAADRLLSGQGNYAELVKAQLDAYGHALLEAERSKMRTQITRELREQSQSRNATEQMRAADAGRSGSEPTHVSGGISPTVDTASLRARLRDPNTTQPERQKLLKQLYGE
jgi:hypothetical protein